MVAYVDWPLHACWDQRSIVIACRIQQIALNFSDPIRTRLASSKAMKRYAAKLFFQFRRSNSKREHQRRLCEERIVLFLAPNGPAALRAAKRRGKLDEHVLPGRHGQVHFEFIGVLDLLELGAESEDDEVWWEFVERLS